MEVGISHNHRRWRAPFTGLVLLFALMALLGSPAAAAVPGQISPTATTLLNQPPGDGSDRLADTQDLKSVAENFVLSAPATVTQVVLWGSYVDGDTSPAADNFSVNVFTDSAGWLGAPIYAESGVAYSRVQTGVMDGGVHVWRHTLTLAAPVSLAPGTFWLWFYNNTPGSPDNYQNSAGSLDGVNGISGSYFSFIGTLGTYWVALPEERAVRLVQSNSPPVAENDGYVATFERPLIVAAGEGVLDNDSDADGDVLAAVLDTGPVGELNLSADGSFVYTPTLGFRGPDTFTYHADDGITASPVATATINVMHPPSIILTSPEDGATDVPLGEDALVTFSEAIETATFTYTVAPDPGGWTETWNGAKIQVTLSHENFGRWTTVTLAATGAQDLTGNPMADPYVWSFLTEPYWQYMPIVSKRAPHQPNRR